MPNNFIVTENEFSHIQKISIDFSLVTKYVNWFLLQVYRLTNLTYNYQSTEKPLLATIKDLLLEAINHVSIIILQLENLKYSFICQNTEGTVASGWSTNYTYTI